ncbi:Zn-dependent protease [Candidatus Scalindua japonica]|uniref:Zn-dependent protease n=1 Tax=Candidatus Scalindua japonica TaxID=1284222 RepID=A0A286U1U1_9BACT|nr:M48 family metalloprotease [Candidatus Scalindua japonica]GAX62108.1 Zn-dependent protease [Candidatus Scalindua japonica]
MMRKLFIIVTLCSVTLYGCATNPVTGKRELGLVPTSSELEIGKQQYIPSRQMEGGDYTIDKELTEYVSGVGQRLAAVSDRKLPYEFAVLNNSIPNAWALPGGKIAINRGLLTELKNEAELAAVLGHEIVHAAARHGAKGMERGIFLQGAVALAGIASQGSGYANLAVQGSQIAAGLINQKYGRNAELESDLYGMKYMSRAGYDPKAAISVQETFLRLSEEAGRETDWLSGLFSSHPPSQERIDVNRVTAKTLPEGGELGVQRFQKKIAYIMKTRNAYEAYDNGIKALSKGKTGEALALAKKAISGEPKEGQFHALVGDINMKQQQYQNALKSYNKAVELNNEFFYFFVQRGLSKQKLGDQHGARTDLEKSTKLLPTATAMNALGNMSLAQGNQQEALQYFKIASSSNSEVGRQAEQSFIRLDMRQQPNNYIKTRINLTQKRYVVIMVANPTPIAVQNVKVKILYPDTQGKVMEIVKDVSNILSPGKSTIIETGLGPVENTNILRYMRVNVIRADVTE